MVSTVNIPHFLIQPVTAVKPMLHAVFVSTIALGTENIAITLSTLPKDPSQLMVTPATHNTVVTQTYMYVYRVNINNQDTIHHYTNLTFSVHL